MNGEKARIRKHFLKIRSSLSEEERKKKSDAVLIQLRTSRFFRQTQQVLAFYPLPGEIDISGVRQLCYETGKRIAYPRVLGSQMHFYEVLPEDELTEGTFHVMEPAEGKAPVDWEDGMCLTPGIAFDGFGNRCGYGKGYYDRYFFEHGSFLRIGVCFQVQISQRPLPSAEFDQQVEYLLTENGISRCEDVGGKMPQAACDL